MLLSCSLQVEDVFHHNKINYFWKFGAILKSMQIREFKKKFQFIKFEFSVYDCDIEAAGQLSLPSLWTQSGVCKSYMGLWLGAHLCRVALRSYYG